jgi:hypothetical protein
MANLDRPASTTFELMTSSKEISLATSFRVLQPIRRREREWKREGRRGRERKGDRGRERKREVEEREVTNARSHLDIFAPIICLPSRIL